MPHSEKKAKKICGKLSTYFYPQYSAPATLSGHIGPNKEKMTHNLFEEKAEKAMGGLGETAEVEGENWGRLEVTEVSKERD